MPGITLKRKSYARADQQNYKVQESGGFKESIQVNGASTPGIAYCCAVWSPHFIKKDKQMLEKIQHRFTRMFSHLKNLLYEDSSVNLDCGRSKRGETEQIL